MGARPTTTRIDRVTRSTQVMIGEASHAVEFHFERCSVSTLPRIDLEVLDADTSVRVEFGDRGRRVQTDGDVERFAAASKGDAPFAQLRDQRRRIVQSATADPAVSESRGALNSRERNSARVGES